MPRAITAGRFQSTWVMHYLEGHLPMPSSNQYHRWTILTTPHRLVIKVSPFLERPHHKIMSAKQHHSIVLPYKQLGNGTDVVLDVYPPPFLTQSTSYRTSSNVDNIPVIPAVVHFHGGGLSVGNKESFIPSWLIGELVCNIYTPRHSTIDATSIADIV